MKEEIKLNSEEKMKKKFRSYRRIMTFFEGLFLFGFISIFLLGGILGLFVKSTGTDVGENVAVEESQEEFNFKDEFIKNIELDDLIESSKDYSENMKIFIIGKYIFLTILGYILILVIIDSLVGIFKEIEISGTPFTEKNIKLVKKISIISFILWIFGLMGANISIGLISVIVIFAFRSVFEYGYKLQVESDETL